MMLWQTIPVLPCPTQERQVANHEPNYYQMPPEPASFWTMPFKPFPNVLPSIEFDLPTMTPPILDQPVPSQARLYVLSAPTCLQRMASRKPRSQLPFRLQYTQAPIPTIEWFRRTNHDPMNQPLDRRMRPRAYSGKPCQSFVELDWDVREYCVTFMDYLSRLRLQMSCRTMRSEIKPQDCPVDWKTAGCMHAIKYFPQHRIDAKVNGRRREDGGSAACMACFTVREPRCFGNTASQANYALEVPDGRGSFYLLRMLNDDENGTGDGFDAHSDSDRARTPALSYTSTPASMAHALPALPAPAGSTYEFAMAKTAMVPYQQQQDLWQQDLQLRHQQQLQQYQQRRASTASTASRYGFKTAKTAMAPYQQRRDQRQQGQQPHRQQQQLQQCQQGRTNRYEPLEQYNRTYLRMFCWECGVFENLHRQGDLIKTRIGQTLWVCGCSLELLDVPFFPYKIVPCVHERNIVLQCNRCQAKAPFRAAV